VKKRTQGIFLNQEYNTVMRTNKYHITPSFNNNKPLTGGKHSLTNTPTAVFFHNPPLLPDNKRLQRQVVCVYKHKRCYAIVTGEKADASHVRKL